MSPLFMSPETQQTSADIQLLAWYESNKQRVFLGLGALIVLVGIYFLMVELNREKEAAAAMALSTARSDSGPLPPGSDKLLQIAQEHSGTFAGEQAAFLGATALFTEGKHAEAQARFESFLKDYSASPLASGAAYGIATALEAQGKFDEAASAYLRVTTQHAGTAVAAQSTLGQGRLLELQGKFAEALKVYQDMERSGAVNVFVAEARQKRESLERRHPELKPAAAETATPAGTTAPTGAPATGAKP